MPSVKIIEEKIRGRAEPYHMGVEYEPISFTLNFAFDGGFTSDKLRAVARWLYRDFYQPLIFEQRADRIYYAMATEQPKLIHNGANQGYVSVTFRCNSPFSFSPVYVNNLIDFSNNTSDGTYLSFTNIGDLPIKPSFEVDIVSGNYFKIQNLSDGGKFMEFSGLLTGESLRIDGDLRTIDSNLPLSFPYDKQSYKSDFIQLLQGVNYLRIFGNVRLKIITQYKYIG
ncbi:hypothetical protein PCURB6_28690 [Paenibacillus curdlanolyticus]|nr:hypothetical protein PCURB6_28690 [Paenibacillus curdlanolyticus]